MTASIEVSTSDFANMNQGLIHLLQAIDSSPGGSISTFKLLKKLNRLWPAHNQACSKRAISQGKNSHLKVRVTIFYSII
jgi:hypothetical protein